MFRRALGLGLLGILSATVGCRMCCHPYDYCGPVYQCDGCGCPSCCGHSRANSVLEPIPQREYAQGSVEYQARSQANNQVRHQAQSQVRRPVQSDADRQMRQEAQAQARPGDVPGSERILSVTDRAVGPTATPTDPPATAEASPGDSSQTLPSSGWTARGSTGGILR